MEFLAFLSALGLKHLKLKVEFVNSVEPDEPAHNELPYLYLNRLLSVL